MKDFIRYHPWKILQDSWDPTEQQVAESIFSIGNGYMGVRGNLSETYTGSSLQGSYIAGIYYPDKTRVGWWKNGYPEYFAKVPNACRWIDIKVLLDNYEVDLHTCEVLSHEVELDMMSGLYRRATMVMIPGGSRIKITEERFCSMAQKELASQRYEISSIDYAGHISLYGGIDGDVRNADANYDENFWEALDEGSHQDWLYVRARTYKTAFEVYAAMTSQCHLRSQSLDAYAEIRPQTIGHRYDTRIKPGDTLTLYKHVCIVHSMHLSSEDMVSYAGHLLEKSSPTSYLHHREVHKSWWRNHWKMSDIQIEGDVAAQQGIRYNIFQLMQTYTGQDARLNIGPKGLTGEKYGGSTYWDTEAYCLPFYLSTAPSEVARNLLIYRYNHLDKAIENAQKLGFGSGAALYPMVTMNGEECHNEWEITFEEIHRNGAIAYAIYNYINYTGDKAYLLEYGLQVLISIARFWSQRCQYSEDKSAWVILGVTGPNEYENNVQNNWYTNYIAAWCMRYAAEGIEAAREMDEDRLHILLEELRFNETECLEWKARYEAMYYPYDPKSKIWLQQDGFLDKEIKPVSAISPQELPICQHWSWDRILRSCYIKQADVLQGMYFFESSFSEEEIKRHFDYYEPLTVHESSLSPCIHALLASRIGEVEIAYKLYLRTARLDLEDYNNDTEDGLHITSMAGTWLAIVQGFGGMRVKDGILHFRPQLPKAWQELSFHILFRQHQLNITMIPETVKIENNSNEKISLFVLNQLYDVPAEGELIVDLSLTTQMIQ